MQLRVQASALFPRSPEDAFAVVTRDENFVTAFRGGGPIAGLARFENLGDAFEVGLERIVHSEDGSTVRERMVVVDPPHAQAYVLSDFDRPFSWLVAGARADWTLTAEGEGTRVVWDYAFDLTTPLAWPLVRVLMVFFGRAQQTAMDTLATLEPTPTRAT